VKRTIDSELYFGVEGRDEVNAVGDPKRHVEAVGEDEAGCAEEAKEDTGFAE
jgi:hypothetical protein